MNEIILGVKVGIRESSKRPGLLEARLTWGGKRKSFYDRSREGLLTKVKQYLEQSQAIKEVAVRADLLDDLGYWVATNLGPHYAAIPNKNTRVKGLWAVGVVSKAATGTSIRSLTLAQTQSVWARVRATTESAHTQRTLLGVFSRSLRLLQREGKIPYNFAEELSRPKLPKRKHVPSPADVMKVLLMFKDDYLGPKLFLEFVLGLCDEEACNARLEDFDGESLFVRGTKTAYRERSIALPPEIAGILAGYARNRRRYFVENTRGNPVCPGSTRDLKLRFEKAGVKWCGNHGLRHAFGAIETAVGCPPSIRLAILGQSLTGLVQHMYVHPDQEEMRVWLAKWAKFLNLCLVPEWGTTGVQSLLVTPKKEKTGSKFGGA